MSGYSAVNYIVARPWLYKVVKPISDWYCNAAGWRQMGLKADDLIDEENEIVQKALKRLSSKEKYDRVFRLRRAIQLSISHQPLPKEQHIKQEEDYPYLLNVIKQVEAEEKERNDLNSLTLKKRSN